MNRGLCVQHIRGATATGSGMPSTVACPGLCHGFWGFGSSS